MYFEIGASYDSLTVTMLEKNSAFLLNVEQFARNKFRQI